MWDLLCFQLVMIVFVFVGAATPAAMLVKALGTKNDATILVQFPSGKKRDGIDLKKLAEYWLVEQDLFTDFVFEKGFDVTSMQDVAAIDATNRVMKQPEASTVVALTDAASEAAMAMLRSWADFAPPAAIGSAEASAASATVEANIVSSSGKCVCLPHDFSDEAWVHCRACYGPLFGDLQQQAAGSIFAGEAEVSSSCNDDPPDMLELHGAFTLTNSSPHFLQEREGAARPPGSAKKTSFCERRWINPYCLEVIL